MKVLLVGGLNLAESLWCVHRGFERLGCSLVYVPTLESVHGTSKRPRAAAQPEIEEAAAQADLLFWWQAQTDAWARIVPALRQAHPKLRTVAMSIDDPYAIDHLRPNHSLGFEFAVTCCKGSLPWYAEHGVKAMVGYPPVDRDVHGLASPDPKYRCDISFAATNVYPASFGGTNPFTRVQMIDAVEGLGDVRVYGGWGATQHDWGGRFGLGDDHMRLWRGTLPYAELPAKVFSASRINLCNHVRPDGEGYLNERVTECLASGGFLLCDRVKGIESIFAEDKEIVLWSTLEELREKAKYYLEHEAERAAIAAAGRTKALALFDNAKLAREVLALTGLG